jgi:integrase
LDVYQEYKKFAMGRYPTPGPRNTVRRFLRSLNLQGLQKITDAQIGEVDAFLADEGKTCKKPRIEFVKVFFDLLIERDLYHDRNPVHPDIHYSDESESEPRAYDPTTVHELWGWIANSNDARLKLVFAFGEESGPQLHQLCHMRIPDLDQEEWCVSLRDSSGEEIIGWTPFGEKTNEWLQVWLHRRPDHRGHDYLLTNAFGDPLTVEVLGGLLNRAFAGKTIPGLGKFRYEFLRNANIASQRANGVSDEVIMQFHTMQDVSTIKRFDLLLTEEERERFQRASEEMDGEQ